MWLVFVSAAGTIVSIVWVLATRRHVLAIGDAFVFRGQASLIVNGGGWFVSPFPPFAPSAYHPPLWTLVLAAADAIGLKSYLSQLLVACVLGGGAIFMTGMAGREVAGQRAGLIAAAIAVVYPNYWMNEGTGLSETLVLLLVASVVFMAVRLWHKPSFVRVGILGFLCALAALTRSEQVLLIAVVLVPLTVVLRGLSLRRRLGLATAGVLVGLFTLGPWVGFNLTRFDHPVFLSGNLGATLAAANCRYAYYGHHIGYADLRCPTVSQQGGDESTIDARERAVAFGYMRKHLSRVPVVMVARVGREFGLYDPLGQIHLDATFESRPLIPAEIGLFMYYAMAIASVFGAIVLKRRGIMLVPFAGLLFEVVLSAMLAIGATRYRVPLEVGLAVLTAVTIDYMFVGVGASPRRAGAHSASSGVLRSNTGSMDG
jgi:4-amino-4-deoxy-L-arabinose transferase-like glycosyltransferase